MHVKKVDDIESHVLESANGVSRTDADRSRGRS